MKQDIKKNILPDTKNTLLWLEIAKYILAYKSKIQRFLML